MGWLARLRGWAGASAAGTDGPDLAGLPPDISERNALDVWHFVAFRAFGGHVLAPVVHPEAVLDVACGTGRWARDVARIYPQARVVGFDLDKQQVSRALEEGSWRGDDLLPPNCRYEQADALGTFPYQDASFDYTHLRFFSPFVPTERLLQVLAEMARVTRPGGWVEAVDAARFAAQDQGREYLLQCLRDLYVYNGLTLEPGAILEDYLRQVGLKRVRSRTATLRAGPRQDPASARLGQDLFAGMANAAHLYVETGIASLHQVSAALHQAQSARGDAAIQVALTAAWGQRSVTV